MMIAKPLALVTIVADNRMIGNADDSPLPFNFASGLDWILHVEDGKTEAGKDQDPKAYLKHNLIYGRRVYEEFAGYGILPSGGGVNYVVSKSMAHPDGTPKPLPTVLGDDSTVNPRLLAVGSIEQAVELGTKLETDSYQPGEMCLVLGGQRIYTDTLPHATFLRMIRMRANFDGGILFPEYDEKEWTPIYKSKPKVETNQVDGKDLEVQLFEYVRAKDAKDPALAPVLESIQKVNRAFAAFEPLVDD